MDHKKSTTEIDELLFRCLEGVADNVEYKQAWLWVRQSPQNRTYYEKMRDAWIAAGLLKPVDAYRQRQVWSQIEKKMQSEEDMPGMESKKDLPGLKDPAGRGKIIRMKYLRWVAAAAVVVFAYILGKQTSVKYENLEDTKGEYTIEAPKGGKSVMTLSDGSKVWLNAGSVLYFDNAFGVQNRNLALQGEAYFEVAHDTERPFLVKTSGITITALGTAFNVKAYSDEDMIETTLVEGSVRIEANKTKTIVLEPNQKVIFYKSQQSISVHSNHDVVPMEKKQTDILQNFSKIELSKDVDVEVSTSWKDKRWIVMGERLGAFAAIIERKYDVALVFEDPDLEDYRISATLEEETIEQLFNAIRLTVPMDYRIERNYVYLKMNWQLKMKYDRLIHNR